MENDRKKEIEGERTRKRHRKVMKTRKVEFSFPSRKRMFKKNLKKRGVSLFIKKREKRQSKGLRDVPIQSYIAIPASAESKWPTLYSYRGLRYRVQFDYLRRRRPKSEWKIQEIEKQQQKKQDRKKAFF